MRSLDTPVIQELADELGSCLMALLRRGFPLQAVDRYQVDVWQRQEFERLWTHLHRMDNKLAPAIGDEYDSFKQAPLFGKPLSGKALRASQGS